MKLLRPYIPLDIRCRVALRQLGYSDIDKIIEAHRADLTVAPKYRRTHAKLLRSLLPLISSERLHLDHDPALENRIRVHDKNGNVIDYEPAANDPQHLIYRTADGHKTKTLVRGDGAQRSDAAQRRYLNRVEQNRGLRKKKPTRKIAQRKTIWPKRKFQTSRSTK